MGEGEADAVADANAQKDMAEAIGVTPGYYALQESGKAKLGTTHAMGIASKLSVQPLWITEGIQPVTESPFLLFVLPARGLEFLTTEEAAQFGSRWLENGAKLEEATFVYYPSELSGLIYALSQEVENWLSEQ